MLLNENYQLAVNMLWIADINSRWKKKHKVDDDGEEDTDNDDVDADKKQGYKVLEGWESIRWRDTGASDGVHSVNTILMRTLSHNTREIQRQRQM